MKAKKIIIIAIIAILALFAGFRVFGLYLSKTSEERRAFYDYVSSQGPWAEQSIWESSDKQAYLLAEKSDDDSFATVTAYFYFEEAWHPFLMDLTYGNELVFADKTNDTMDSVFTSDVDFKDDIFTVKDLKPANEDGGMLPCDTYVFSRAADYEELISQLPFEP